MADFVKFFYFMRLVFSIILCFPVPSATYLAALMILFLPTDFIAIGMLQKVIPVLNELNTMP
jgi:hypothetical protein